jgi:S-adenosylmethionine decarboxylase
MRPLPTNAYGQLLTLDGYGASREMCADIDRLYKLLEQLPKAIGMRPLGFPHIVSVDEPGIAGLSGFTFIMESHISIHTYEERGFITADVYSCKNFDTAAAAAYIAEHFEIATFETNVIVRGKKFNLPTSSVLAVTGQQNS